MVASGDYVRIGDPTGSGNDCNVDYDYVRITPGVGWDVRPLLWADNGQDYLRFDTGNDGTSRTLYYTLGGGGSSWDTIDFATPVLVEFRARVDSDTSEGAANILLGDGSNGYVVVELSGSGVNVEGAGGDAGEVSYGFDTSDWHDYRLTIAPDPNEGDAIRAKLYLDGDYSSPILVQALNSSTSYDEITIGDTDGSNNGIWDLDYLRFATGSCGLQPYPTGDITEDCIVDMSDLKIVLDNWLMWDYVPPVTGDLTSDNRVDLDDYAVIGNNWMDDRRP
jgi:hypothetical protein